MRIDPKYFNVFLLIVALIAAALIAFYTLQNRSNETQAFKERMFNQDSLQTVYWTKVQENDSLQISDFKDKYVITNFWGSWSSNDLESHEHLADLKGEFPDELEVIAAAVGLQRKEAESYIEDHSFPFHFVAGSQQFSELKIPGLPAYLIFNPQGKLQKAFLGYQGGAHLDSLRVLITDEQ